MLKVYDYYCSLCDSQEELFVDSNLEDEQYCQNCDALMTRLKSAPKGYVKGTINPVKQ